MSQAEATALAIQYAGGPSAVARDLGFTRSAISQWKTSGRVPADRVIALERLCDARVTRYELRPDIYPR